MNNFANCLQHYFAGGYGRMIEDTERVLVSQGFPETCWVSGQVNVIAIPTTPHGLRQYTMAYANVGDWRSQNHSSRHSNSESEVSIERIGRKSNRVETSNVYSTQSGPRID